MVAASGRAVGTVTSFAYVHENLTFIALACVAHDFRPTPGEAVRGVRTAPGKVGDTIEERSVVELTALTRFPDDDEREAWPGRYGAD